MTLQTRIRNRSLLLQLSIQPMIHLGKGNGKTYDRNTDGSTLSSFAATPAELPAVIVRCLEEICTIILERKADIDVRNRSITAINDGACLVMRFRLTRLAQPIQFFTQRLASPLCRFHLNPHVRRGTQSLSSTRPTLLQSKMSRISTRSSDKEA